MQTINRILQTFGSKYRLGLSTKHSLLLGMVPGVIEVYISRSEIVSLTDRLRQKFYTVKLIENHSRPPYILSIEGRTFEVITARRVGLTNFDYVTYNPEVSKFLDDVGNKLNKKGISTLLCERMQGLSYFIHRRGTKISV